MSTTNSIESMRGVINAYSTHNYVHRDEEQETLADAVRRLLFERNISQNQAAARARARGYSLAQSYISKIVSGATTNVTIGKLQALAAGLDVPIECLMVGDIHANQQLAIEEALVNALPYKFGSLSEKDKEQIRPMLEMIMREIDERARRSHS